MATPDGILRAATLMYECGSIKTQWGATPATTAEIWLKNFTDIPDNVFLRVVEAWIANEKEIPSCKQLRVYLKEVMHYQDRKTEEKLPDDADKRKTYLRAQANCALVLEATQEGWDAEKLMKNLQLINGAPVSDKPAGLEVKSWLQLWLHTILPVMCMEGGYYPPPEMREAMKHAYHPKPDGSISLKPEVKAVEPLVLELGTPEQDAFVDWVFGSDEASEPPKPPEIPAVF